MQKQLLYFGCIKEKGHYLWQFENSKMYNLNGFKGINSKVLDHLDGIFTPAFPKQGNAMFSKVGPIAILAWHDYTVDQRPGSNSALIGVGYHDTIEILNDAHKLFPSVIKRQTVPINVLEA